ncbi:hypothetical protein DKX38_021345 [Salix brachista]|uniref:Indole-3-acetic acid-amido synthetase GH3.6 n=1 Tax=Salix brachista TaxID=2182728 RepID=A0A5N5K7M9_9ROSI|nr:hypothetical protein DKX38_021345 [Salix brachista]
MMTYDELVRNLEDLTENAAHHQLQTLHSILQHQASVSYLQPYLSACDGPVDGATFRSRVPLSSYDDCFHLINQLANGDIDHHQPLLSADPLLCFFYSSGTSTMKPKLIPYFDSALSRAASYNAHQGSAAIFRKLVPPRPEVNKVLWFLYADEVTTTRGGFKVMAASTYPLQGNKSRSNWSQTISCISPREVVFGTNIEHQMYCHLLCALRNFDRIDGIRAAYAAGLIRAFSLLESKWEKLCDDLESGFPSLEIADAAMKESVVEFLGGPQVDLSRRIREICAESNWGGILSKLWPNVRYVKAVTTGSMKQYYPKLKHYAGDVMILGGDYFASECCLGTNLDIQQPPESTRFVMLPTAAYFEFLPFDLNERGVAGEETVDFSGVKVGKMYEVAVTTYRGLYRYRLGDIVSVVGFHNSSPLIEFVMRAPKTAGEIITEKDLTSAVDSFQHSTAAEVVEFASFSDYELSPKQLKVFIEFREGCVFLQEEKLKESAGALRSCCSSLESGMGEIYKVQRDRGEIGPLVVSFVRSGTFDGILHIAIKNGAPASQYKPPKIIRSPEIVGFMEESAEVAKPLVLLAFVCDGNKL